MHENKQTLILSSLAIEQAVSAEAAIAQASLPQETVQTHMKWLIKTWKLQTDLGEWN